MNTNPNPSSGKWNSGLDFLAVFFVGFLALVLQVCCTRVAVGTFGSSSMTLSAMIVVSLAGLSVGSWFGGRKADRSNNLSLIPAISFVFVSQFAIVLGCWSVFLANGIDALFRQLTDKIWPAQFGFAILTMLPTNFALGTIVPTLIKRLSGNQIANAFRSFSLVYSFETIGAALGALLSAFVLIPQFGVSISLFLTAAICLCFAVVYGAIRYENPNVASVQNTNSDTAAWSHRLILLVVALAGCCSLGMEVIWQRFFVVWFGSDTQSFAIVVAAILVGVAIGAIIASFVGNLITGTRKIYGWILFSVSFSVLATCLFLVQGFDDLESMLWSSRLLSSSPILTRFLLSFMILLLPTSLIGLGLPLAIQIWVRDTKLMGMQVGQLYSAALLGNLAGVLMCGFLLVPNFGLRPSAVILSSCCLVAALLLFAIQPKTELSKAAGRSQGLVGRIAIVACLGAWIFLANFLVGEKSELGLTSIRKDWVTDFYSENSTNTVAVIRANSDPSKRKMLIDGVSIGESGGGVDQKQQLLAHLPFIVKPQKTGSRVLTIGLGTGILAGELLENSNVSSVTCVELSPGVIQAAELFADLNGEIFGNKKFELVQADGIRFLRHTKWRYSVIVSDAKSRPGHAGNAAFFSRDYYQLCNEKLANNGIFLQWVSLKTSDTSLKTILKTFAGVFPYGHIGIAAPDSIFLVGTRDRLELDKPWIEKYLLTKSADSLRKYDFQSYSDILSLYWLDQGVVHQNLLEVPINSFSRPILESFGLSSFKHSTEKTARQLKFLQELIQLDMHDDVAKSKFNSKESDHDSNAQLLKDLISGRRGAQEIINANVLIAELDSDWLDQATNHYRQAMASLPGLSRQMRIARIYRELAVKANADAKDNLEFSALLNISELDSSNAADEFRIAEILIRNKQQESALEHFYQAVKKSPNDPRYRVAFGFCMLNLKKFGQAGAQFKRVLANDSEHAEARLGLGISQVKSGLTEVGVENVRKAVHRDKKLETKLVEYGIEKNEN